MRISDWSSDVCSSDLRIIAGARLLGLMVEPLAIARTGFGGIARIELDAIDGTDLRHDQDVAEVRMAGAREMRVTEPLDRRIGVAVTRGMIVAVSNLAGRVGVGRQLDHAERRGRAGQGMAFGARSEENTAGIH